MNGRKISPEALKFIRTRLPIELKNLIYAYIDIETRLTILLQHKSTIYNDLYRLPDSTLVKLFETCIVDKITVKLGRTSPYSPIAYKLTKPFQLLPMSIYKSNTRINKIPHPAVNDVISNSTLQYMPMKSQYSITDPTRTDHRRVQYMVARIRGVIELYSSLYTPSRVDIRAGRTISRFDYAIRKRLFAFLHCIHKQTVHFKKIDAEKQRVILINRAERHHKRMFNRRILKAVMKKSLIMTNKRERLAKKEATLQAKIAKKEAAVQARLDKKEAVAQAKLDKK